VARHVERQVRRRIERETRKASHVAKREIHRAKREAQRAERKARRYARGNWHRPGAPVMPGRALAVLILLALSVASVATFALFQVLLPILFTFIPVQGRRQRMLDIGRAGERGLQRAREHIRYQFLGGPIPAELEPFMTDAAARDAGATAEHDAMRADRPARNRVSIDVEAEEAEEAEAETETAARAKADVKHARR